MMTHDDFVDAMMQEMNGIMAACPRGCALVDDMIDAVQVMAAKGYRGEHREQYVRVAQTLSSYLLMHGLIVEVSPFDHRFRSYRLCDIPNDTKSPTFLSLASTLLYAVTMRPDIFEVTDVGNCDVAAESGQVGNREDATGGR